MNDYNLTPEEQEVEEHARKNRPVNLRMSEFDLELVKKRAKSEGLPYHTFITMVVHKYVTDQLVDRHELRNVIAKTRDMRAT